MSTAQLISIHPLLAERDTVTPTEGAEFEKFQSTRSSRSGTSPFHSLRSLALNFNPPAPRGAGPGDIDKEFQQIPFQSTRSSRSGTVKMIE